MKNASNKIYGKFFEDTTYTQINISLPDLSYDQRSRFPSTSHRCSLEKGQENPLVQGRVGGATKAIKITPTPNSGINDSEEFKCSQFRTNKRGWFYICTTHNAQICTKVYFGICVLIKEGDNGLGKTFLSIIPKASWSQKGDQSNNYIKNKINLSVKKKSHKLGNICQQNNPK